MKYNLVKKLKRGKSLKILIISMFPNKVNINTYNKQEIGLAKSLIKNGNICDIVYYNGEEQDKVEEYKFGDNLKFNIYWLKGKDFFGNAIYNKKIFDLIKNYDVIQSSEYNQILNSKIYRKIKDKLVIYHGPYHNDFSYKDNIKEYIFDIYISIFHRKYKNVHLIAKSKLSEDFLKKKGYKNVKKIGVGIDKERLIRTDNLEQHEIVNIKEKIVLYIGQIQKRRNVDFIINTYAKVYEENKNTKLVIVGKGKEKYVNKCMKIIEEKGLKQNVIIIPQMNQEQLGELYEKAKVFLLPTNYEIFGMVLLEAMLYGVPVITTYNGGSSTLIENEKNGFIYDELNEDLWKAKILELLKNDNIDISINAKENIEKNFTWDKLVPKFLQIYEDSINLK